MTDKEMAKQFADNISGLELTCSLLSAKDKSQAYRLGRYDGFLAGLHEGQEENHKLLDVINNQDVKIADLEQKLEQTEKDLADYQFNYPTIKELSKENTELKNQIEKMKCCANCENVGDFMTCTIPNCSHKDHWKLKE